MTQQPPVAPVLSGLRIKGHQPPEVGPDPPPGAVLELRGHHPHHGVHRPASRIWRPMICGSPPKRLLPEPGADHHHPIAARLLLLLEEAAAQAGLHLQHVQKSGADVHGPHGRRRLPRAAPARGRAGCRRPPLRIAAAAGGRPGRQRPNVHRSSRPLRRPVATAPAGPARGYGSARSTHVLTSENMVTDVPRPSARMATDSAVNPGCRASRRSADRSAPRSPTPHASGAVVTGAVRPGILVSSTTRPSNRWMLRVACRA